MKTKVLNQFRLCLLILPATVPVHAAPETRQEIRSLENPQDQAFQQEAAEYLFNLSTTAPQMREKREQTTREARPLSSVPEIYQQLDSVKITLSVRISGHDQTEELQRTIMRTSDKVYMSYLGQGQEWLFEKNPMDTRRVSGQLIDHRQAHVLLYHESELHNFGIVSNWTDVVTLGVKLDVLESMTSTGNTETFEGIQFLHYRSEARETGDPATEIWWSEAKALPLRIIRREGGTTWTQELSSLDWSTEENLLTEPAKRFPEYPVMDYVDWQEEYHETEGESGHHH